MQQQHKYHLQPGYVPRLGMEPTALQCTGQHANQLSRTGQAEKWILKRNSILMNFNQMLVAPVASDHRPGQRSYRVLVKDLGSGVTDPGFPPGFPLAVMGPNNFLPLLLPEVTSLVG